MLILWGNLGADPPMELILNSRVKSERRIQNKYCTKGAKTISSDMAEKQTVIYRITRYKNLEGILIRGGIYATNFQPDDGIEYYPIHHVGIQNLRSDTLVPCGPGGCIHDYVPFYFGPRSPMLYAIHKNNVAGYTGGQQPIIYICAYVENVNKQGLEFVFTDGHAIMTHLTHFYDNLDDLKKLDWDVIRGKYWFDNEQNPDRCRRRQAEFLVYKFLPLESIFGIVVIDKRMKNKVDSTLVKHNISMPIVVNRTWYY